MNQINCELFYYLSKFTKTKEGKALLEKDAKDFMNEKSVILFEHIAKQKKYNKPELISHVATNEQLVFIVFSKEIGEKEGFTLSPETEYGVVAMKDGFSYDITQASPPEFIKAIIKDCDKTSVEKILGEPFTGIPE